MKVEDLRLLDSCGNLKDATSVCREWDILPHKHSPSFETFLLEPSSSSVPSFESNAELVLENGVLEQETKSQNSS